MWFTFLYFSVKELQYYVIQIDFAKRMPTDIHWQVTISVLRY